MRCRSDFFQTAICWYIGFSRSNGLAFCLVAPVEGRRFFRLESTLQQQNRSELHRVFVLAPQTSKSIKTFLGLANDSPTRTFALLPAPSRCYCPLRVARQGTDDLSKILMWVPTETKLADQKSQGPMGNESAAAVFAPKERSGGTIARSA